MNIQEYSALALRTASDLGGVMNLVHGALLVTSEAGEIADVIKKKVAYGKELDREHLLEECGDLLWGINLLLATTGLTWEQVMTKNIAKLEARYPGGTFNAALALDRNLDAEKAAMEAA
jgi:NTP pyrophosphatase (non-canonical NTP hydrolase)